MEYCYTARSGPDSEQPAPWQEGRGGNLHPLMTSKQLIFDVILKILHKIDITAETSFVFEIHDGHMGVVKMKLIARNFVWHPGIDHNIEKVVKGCAGCQQVQNMPSPAP